MLLVSPAHRYGGRPRDGAAPPPPGPESVSRAQVVAGRGMAGDHCSLRRERADAAVTLLAVEALEAVALELGVAPFDPALARRNVVLRGADVEALLGAAFTLDCGDGPVFCDAEGHDRVAQVLLSSGGHRGVERASPAGL